MKNQSNGKGGGSVKVQAMKKDLPKNISGHGPAAGSSKGKSTVAASAGQSGSEGTIVPASVKGPHD